MRQTLPPSIAANVATRVYDIKDSYSFTEEFNIGFLDNFKITNNQIRGVSGGLINQLLNLVTQITGSQQG